MALNLLSTICGRKAESLLRHTQLQTRDSPFLLCHPVLSTLSSLGLPTPMHHSWHTEFTSASSSGPCTQRREGGTILCEETDGEGHSRGAGGTHSTSQAHKARPMVPRQLRGSYCCVTHPQGELSAGHCGSMGRAPWWGCSGCLGHLHGTLPPDGSSTGKLQV